MTFSRQTLWVGACLPMLLLFILSALHPSNCTSNDPEDAYSPDWVQDRQDKRVSEFLGGPGKRVSEFLGGPGKRISEFLGGPGKRVSEFLGGPGKRVSEFLGGPGKRYPAGNNLHQALSKRVSEFLGGPGKRSDYYDFMENAEKR
ncbi:unnamed protein product [Larinioides sclopetarius]|uniref:Uncharacterized protein n=1 Tax=Larinioides sclopetarius TaxID=280406 RepID=A0AAV2B7Y2_9ARAC